MANLTRQQLLQKADEFIAQNKDAMVAHLARLVAVRSVEDMSTAGPGAPFGQGPRQALDEALAIVKELGLEAHDCDGYLGWAELPGQQEDYIATITHMDVVPEGEGWDADPYQLREKEGWLLARGVTDDKGPAILCLYATKFFKELGEAPRYGIRALLGCNEETGMEDAKYYLQRNPQPLFCFTPDAVFPVCNGEKGHFGGYFASAKLQGNIVEFKGGIANNVVPDKAICVIKADAFALTGTDRISVSDAGSGLARLEAKGIGGHASLPAGTINAIGLLVEYLLQHNLCTPQENQFLQLLHKLHSATNGSGIGIACQDDVFDPLTIIGGIIEFEDGVLKQHVDSRFPTATTGDKLTQIAQAQAAQAGGTFVQGRTAEPFYISADSAPIQALLQAYTDITGKEAKTFTMGGGTYARHFAQAVSFGPEEMEEEKPAFVGSVHGANEGANLQAMLEALKIYILALYGLQQLDY